MSIQPSVDNPLLVGLLVDVSGSMMSAIEDRSEGNLNQLQSFQGAISDAEDTNCHSHKENYLSFAPAAPGTEAEL